MLNQDKINKVRGILSAGAGTQVPVFDWEGNANVEDNDPDYIAWLKNNPTGTKSDYLQFKQKNLPGPVEITPTPTMATKAAVVEEEQVQQAEAEVAKPDPGEEVKTVEDPNLIGGETNSSPSAGFTGDLLKAPEKKEVPDVKPKSFAEKASNFLNSDGVKTAGKYASFAGKAADMVSASLVNKADFASDDPTQGSGRQLYDSVADSLMAFAPIGTIAGGAMKAIGLVNDLGGKSADTFSADQSIKEAVGGSYGGTSMDIDSAASKAGKKYGLFAGGARHRANREIAEARRKQNIMGDIADEAAERRSMASTASTGIAAISYNRNLAGGYDQRYMRAAKEGTKIQYFKDPFKVNLTDVIEFAVTLTDVPQVFKQGGTLIDQLDAEHTFVVTLSDPIEELKKGGKIRKNEEGEIVPDKCDACGGDIVVQIHGEPVYLCKKCNKFFGVVPFKHKNGGTLERDIEVIETNTTQKSVIPEGALHKNKHHLDEVGIDDSELTKKGIPVVDNDGDQQAEIELNEIIFTLEVTKELESRYREFYEENTSTSRKDELAIEAGKLLWKEILYNTDDRTGLIDTLKQGGTLGKKSNNKYQTAVDYYKALGFTPENFEFIEDSSPRTEGNKLYVGNEEDAVHELWHFLSNNQPNEKLKEFYDNLNDQRIIELGGDLEFVKRMGDPGQLYNPSEVEARLHAAKYKTKGNQYTKEFFQNARNNENQYGYNFRDLLRMYNDDNLVKLFSLSQGGNITTKKKEKPSKHLQGGVITQEDINEMVKLALINLLNK